MFNKKLLLIGLSLSIVAISGLAWSSVRANSDQSPSIQPTAKPLTCGCGSVDCQAKRQQTEQTGCGCRNKVNFIDNNNNGICDRAE